MDFAILANALSFLLCLLELCSILQISPIPRRTKSELPDSPLIRGSQDCWTNSRVKTRINVLVDK